jgi:S1-C subfamily serine protease
MSGPKHLWSGDWQRESAAASDRLADRQVRPAEPEEPPAPAKAPARARRKVKLSGRPGLGRAVAVVAAALLLIAAGAFGLTSLLGSGGSRNSMLAGAGAARPAVTTPTGFSRPVSWLGIEIQTLPPGAAVVQTAPLGSQGARAGLQPGDVIVEVNHRPISGVGDIGAAIRGLHAGDPVALQFSHGSGIYGTEVTLTTPPSVHP